MGTRLKRMTLARFARLACVSHTAIQKAVKGERLRSVIDEETGTRRVVMDTRAMEYVEKHAEKK